MEEKEQAMNRLRSQFLQWLEETYNESLDDEVIILMKYAPVKNEEAVTGGEHVQGEQQERLKPAAY